MTSFWWFVARRVLVTLPLLVLVTLLGFVLTYLIPADPLAMVLSERAMANPEIVRAYRERWGLDQPPHLRYLTYVGNLLRGDLGTSIATQQPVLSDLKAFVPATVELALAALCVAVAVGLPLGVMAAVRRDRAADHLARVGSLVGVSMPVFWLGLLALAVFYYRLQVAPGPGRLDAQIVPPEPLTGLLIVDSLVRGRWDALADALSHLALPALVLGAYVMGTITRVTRSSVLEVLAQDYVRTARAKGLAERVVIGRHALRNALIPTVTVVGLAFGNLMAGAVMTETIFAWPGIGRYAVEAASKLDFPAIMGVTLFVAVVYVGVNFLVDLTYGLLDPRIRLG
ncbi:MAG: ABC transporter permease [Armatimonadota bacterium]|nr:ABC transporter permease [Armatimonadota bacterium]MDR7533263.1 ABC transporter permease [Armatimonadota bacterium]MDR7536944.1 ABC transporter permease [Armatimonadota bacterium]